VEVCVEVSSGQLARDLVVYLQAINGELWHMLMESPIQKARSSSYILFTCNMQLHFALHTCNMQLQYTFM
jgi:hypothetical protein